MESTKNKIIEIVKAYSEVFFDEYEAVVSYLKKKRNNRNNNFAEIKGNDYVVRSLYEIPETLDNIIQTKLDDKDKQFLKSKEGGHWFVKKFPQFRITEKI